MLPPTEETSAVTPSTLSLPSSSSSFSGTSKASRKNTPASDTEAPLLPEQKRARRRLIGAIALMLLMVILLPMVLDSEPQPLADDIAIQIPSRELTVSSSSVVPAPASLPKPAAVEKAKDVENIAQNAVDKTTVNSSRLPDSSKNISAPTVKAVPPVSKKPVKSHIPASNKGVAVTEKENVAGNVGDSAGDVPADSFKEERSAYVSQSEKSTAKSDEEKKGKKFVLQIAALSSKEKASALQTKLRKSGIAAYAQPVSTLSGERIRVRVGPFNSAAQMQKMQHRLQGLGLQSKAIAVAG